ncbi:unnamed protein product [marine sediment metagenome]|uniref:AraC effector-binding domain-containing protein n=1 Tax=marine sediment metagenome TaxID=412755 RepID=X1A2E8_9ZZZZ
MDTQIDSFYIVGITKKTSNIDNAASNDIGYLWQQFIRENIMDLIPKKVSNDIYAVYTDYESDHLGPYKVIIGCRVSSADFIPDGFECVEIRGGLYRKFSPKGEMPDIVIKEWQNIWNSKLDRTYTTDFELYDQRAANPEDAEIDIYVAINSNNR